MQDRIMPAEVMMKAGGHQASIAHHGLHSNRLRAYAPPRFCQRRKYVRRRQVVLVPYNPAIVGQARGPPGAAVGGRYWFRGGPHLRTRRKSPALREMVLLKIRHMLA